MNDPFASTSELPDETVDMEYTAYESLDTGTIETLKEQLEKAKVRIAELEKVVKSS